MAVTSPARTRSKSSLPQRATRKPKARRRPAVRAARGGGQGTAAAGRGREEGQGGEDARAGDGEQEDAQGHFAAVRLHAEGEEGDAGEDHERDVRDAGAAAAPPAQGGEGEHPAGQGDAHVQDELVDRVAALDAAGDRGRDVAAERAESAEELVEVAGPVRLGQEADPDRQHHPAQQRESAERRAAYQDEDGEDAQHHERGQLVGRDGGGEEGDQQGQEYGQLGAADRLHAALARYAPPRQLAGPAEPDQQHGHEEQVEEVVEGLRGEVVLADPAAEGEQP
ncbi:hypothetical protein GCM10020221_00640 [Streptomyces thioluteus]|uniref:Uncharacterized protein n=1 Tax=Streptomyces thioluteus TaxID=66431 RepID=A0ABN3WB42_STRTU